MPRFAVERLDPTTGKSLGVHEHRYGPHPMGVILDMSGGGVIRGNFPLKKVRGAFPPFDITVGGNGPIKDAYRVRGRDRDVRLFVRSA